MASGIHSPSAETAPLPPGIAEELSAALRSLPFKGALLTLGVAWVLLFHFLGNSTFGYVESGSLFGWMKYAYNSSMDDELGRYIPFMVLGLCWWNRDEILAIPRRPWLGGLAIIGLALAFHVLGFAVQQTRLSVAAFYLGIYGILGALWGPQFLRGIFFPYFLTVFCVPLGTLAETITFPLRMVATTLTTWISQYGLGVALIQHGNQILDAQGTFRYEVAAACGGLRSVTATVALASIYAFISLRSPWRRLVMILAAFPLAVAGNVLRLTCIIVAAEAFGQEAGNWVHDNAYMSLLPYIPAFLGLSLIGSLLKEKSPETTPDNPAPPTSASPSTSAPAPA